jgi:hypothetical protein
MKKLLFIVSFLIASISYSVHAQVLFTAPDTVCVNQPVYIKSNLATYNPSTIFWGFCSGYMLNVPTGNNIGNNFNLVNPSGIEIVKSNNNYFGFVVNNLTQEFLRLEFGNSMANIPTVTNFGTIENTIPAFTNSIYPVQDEFGNWFVFVVGGVDSATSSMARVNFGTNLNSIPSGVNYGNVSGAMNYPRGVFVANDAGIWTAYCVNTGSSTLVRFDIGNNIQLTPTAVDLGNPSFSFAGPSDLAGVFDNGKWYLLVTNAANNTLSTVLLDNQLANPNFFAAQFASQSTFNTPAAISVVQDCGAYHAFVTNFDTHELTRVDFTPSNLGAGFTFTNLSNIGNLLQPSAISNFIRDKDNIYGFVTNVSDSTLTRIGFESCNNAFAPNAYEINPKPVRYNAPGIYNIYCAIDEGMPTSQVMCKPIVVLPIPDLTLSNDTTICQGDIINIVAQAFNADHYSWYPDYNITDTASLTTYVFPEYTVPYHVVISFPSGCIVDTAINVAVSKNKADAGNDRTIFDGARTILGGPSTTIGSNFTYSWSPTDYMTESNTATPHVLPPYDMTYYFTVTNAIGCVSKDTVVVKVTCNDLNLPNAFAPETRVNGGNKFGIMNNQIVQLNFFRIFDRWGKQVFFTTDVSKTWDGTYNGEPCGFGVYVWEADGFCISGKRVTKSGNVTLIR